MIIVTIATAVSCVVRMIIVGKTAPDNPNEQWDGLTTSRINIFPNIHCNDVRVFK